MPELIKHSVSKDGSREIKIIKLSETNFILEFYKMQGPFGNKGFLPPSEDNLLSYAADKLRYELQFEAKMMTLDGKMFNNLQEAEKAAETFLAEENG